MITSMTGFGSGEIEEGSVRVRVELRSVNSRFFDLQIRRPISLQEVEMVVRERLQKRISRGKVTASLAWEEDLEVRGLPRLDAEMAAAYSSGLENLKDMFALEGQADLALLAGLPGLFKVESESTDREEVERLVLLALERAMDDFDRMRETEGAALTKDLIARLATIGIALGRIEQLAAQTADVVRRRLREKIDSLLQPGELDEDRLTVEVALICERSDTTEEIVRFKSHNEQFIGTLNKGGEVGRRLNFLLQEMNREANTISSKATESEIIHLVVGVKEEVERVREQVQNLA